jgi:hypothetical protein
MYINEKVVTQIQLDAGTIPVTTLATTVLDEHIRLHNNITGNADTDIATVDVLIQDNLVKRASKALFTRHIGFEENGIDVILFDEKQTMGSVSKYCVDTILTTSVYDYLKAPLYTLVAEKGSLEDAYAFVSKAKLQIDDIVSRLPTWEDDYAYAMAEILGNTEEKTRLLDAYISISVDTAFVGHEYVRPFAKANLKPSGTPNSINSQIASMSDRVIAIVTDTDMSASKQKQYVLNILALEFGNQLGQFENDKLLKQISKMTLQTKSTIEYFHSFILSQLKGVSKDEVDDEIKAFEDTIVSIVPPSDLSAEDANQYKMNVLLLSNGSELGKVENDRLLKSLIASNVDVIFADVKYDYIRNDIVNILEVSSLNDITIKANQLKSKIDDIVSRLPVWDENYTYAIAEITDNKEEKARLLKSLASTTIDSLLIDTKYAYVRANILPAVNLSTYDSITDSIGQIKTKIDDIVSRLPVWEDDYAYAIAEVTDNAEEKIRLLKSLSSVVADTVFADIKYDYIREDIKELSDNSSYISIEKSLVRLKSKVDDLASRLPVWEDNYTYAIAEMTDNEPEKTRLLKAYASKSIDASFVGTEYVRPFAKTQISHEGTPNSIDSSITSMADRVTSIVADSNLSASKQKQYVLNVLTLEFGSQIGQAENTRLLKEISKMTLQTKTTIKYFHGFILSQIKGESKDEIDDEIQGFEDAISAITAPSGLSAEDTNQYKMNVLLMSKGVELGKIENDRLLKSLIASTVNSIFVDAKYDYIRSNVADMIEVSSYSDISIRATQIKSKIDNIVSMLPTWDDNYNYAIADVADNKEEKTRLLKSLSSVVCDIVFADITYPYIKSELIMLADVSSYISIEKSLAQLKLKIDDIITSITSVYAFITDTNLLYTYALNRIGSEKKSEFALKSEQDNINSIAKYVYHNLVAQSITYPYVADVLLSMPIEKQNIKNINDIQKNITTVENIFVMSRRKILSYGWYFNTMTVTLVPNVSKYIAIPTSYLSVDDNSSNTHTVRDWKLFNNSELTFLFDDPVECVVVDDVPYDDLQQPYRDYVFADARYESYRSILGLSGSAAEISIESKSLSEARILVVRDDANNQDGNLLTDTYSSTLLDRTSL